jgi:branched-chain amino acid transport system ATP-binding protein
MLEVAGLTGGWDQTTVVEDVSLTVAAGETLAIVGRNGVGKSTLLELIVGRALRRSGSVRLGDGDLSRLPVFRRSLAGLGYVPQQREVFASVTVREHLAIASRPGPWTTARILELFPSLARRLGSLGIQLSGGEQQMLAIARALAGNPSVLLMDEPSEGLAPVVVEQLAAALRAVIADGSLAVLLVEQRVDIALDFSDRCLVMERGRIVFSGRSDALREGNAEFAALIGLSDLPVSPVHTSA